MSIDPLSFAPIGAAIYESTLYILHTAEYQVTEVDLRAGSVRRVISRAYKHVKGSSKQVADPDPETMGIDFPENAFIWDIRKIHAAAGNL